MNDKLPKSIQFVKGVGPKRADKLARLGISSIQDLLYYFPREYDDRRELEEIKNLTPGREVTIKAKVRQVRIEKVRPGLKILRVTFADHTGKVTGVWFNQSYLKKQFPKGKGFYLYGELNEKSWQFGKKEINNPVFEEVDTEEPIHLKRIVPIYSLTSGLNQKRIRKIMFQALNDYSPHLKDVLPAELKKKYKFRDLPVSLKGLHFPSNKKHYISAHHRMAFEELFLLQLLVLNRKKGFVQNEGIPHKAPGQIIDSFISSLPFTLTSAQKKVWQEIKQDMEKATPMQRLLQGDVGSGKTVIAVLALIESMANGYQGVFMAPTEILAEQHYLRLKEYFQNLDFNIALLIGSINQSQRQEIKENIKNDKIDLVVGTHALFQKDITYNNLGLVVIDEQHRFGVEQRYSLRKKGENPDLLVMTATPIPRSLALTLYGDLDMSLLDEMPPGRKPVKTSWRQKNARPNVYEFVRKKLNEGQQAFVVCPLIEPSEEISAISAQETEKELKEVLLSGFDIEILHSKISPGEKKAIMDDFRQGKIDVLVSTTVVEVGVDVPNASLMVIEDGQRFGLAQLHQLRGRVGRGQHQSYCIVIAQPTTEDSKKRLQVFTETNDGFKIAEADLEIRGPGEFFGTEQHGMPDLKVANIIKDQKILNRARKEAKNIISHGNLKENYSLLYNRLTDLEVKL